MRPLEHLRQLWRWLLFFVLLALMPWAYEWETGERMESEYRDRVEARVRGLVGGEGALENADAGAGLGRDAAAEEERSDEVEGPSVVAIPLPEFEEPAVAIVPGVRRLRDCDDLYAYVETAYVDHLLHPDRARQRFDWRASPPSTGDNWLAGPDHLVVKHRGGTTEYSADGSRRRRRGAGAPVAAAGPLLVFASLSSEVRGGSHHVAFGHDGRLGVRPERATTGWHSALLTLDSGEATKSFVTGRYTGLTSQGDELWLSTEDQWRVGRLLAREATAFVADNAQAPDLREQLVEIVKLGPGSGRRELGKPDEVRPPVARPQGEAGPPARLACGQTWVPTDALATSAELLVVYRVGAGPTLDVALAVAGGSVVSHMVGPRLYVARPLRGATHGDELERPTTQLEVYDLRTGEFVASSLVDGAPVAAGHVGSEPWLTTTRWAKSELLFHVVDESGAVARTSNHAPETAVARWSGFDVGPPAEAAIGRTTLAPFGEEFVAYTYSNEDVLVEVLSGTGAVVANGRVGGSTSVLKMDELSFDTTTRGGLSKAAALVRTVDDQDLVVATWADDTLDVRLGTSGVRSRPLGGHFVGGTYLVFDQTFAHQVEVPGR